MHVRVIAAGQRVALPGRPRSKCRQRHRPAAAGSGWQERLGGGDAARRAPGAAAAGGDEGAAGLRREVPLRRSGRPEPAQQQASGLIDARSPRYRFWRGLLIGAAALSGIIVPWQLGFAEPASYYDPSHDAVELVDAALVVLFCADLAVSRAVASDEDETLVDDGHASVSEAATSGPGAAPEARARGSRFALDVVGAVPFDLMFFAGAVTLGRMDPGEAAAMAAPLKLLAMARLYRVRFLFRYLEYDLNYSLLPVTVARNLVIIGYLTHWVACAFEAYARSTGFDPALLVGINPVLFTSVTGLERYGYTLYWAVTTLAGNEWNGMDVVDSMAQVAANGARASVFLLFNLALGAYILGTLTLLVVKADERAGRYRDLSANLRTYTALNNLPKDLKDTMQEHLRLSFSNSEASDDQVLSVYPSTLRRRILRHLYLPLLRQSYLFSGVPRKFLDALLSSSRLELFKQGVDIVTAGDSANELYLVVAGTVQLRSPLDSDASMGGDQEMAMWGEDDIMPAVSAYRSSLESSSPGDSIDAPISALTPVLGTADSRGEGGLGPGLPYAGPERELGLGESFGEISFFTEIPQMTTVRSLTTVRVLVISRASYASLERSFPIASRIVLENLRHHTEAAVAREFPGFTGTSDFADLLSRSPGSLMYSWASPELVELMSRPGGGGLAAGGSGLSVRQELVISNLVRVNAVISQIVSKQDEDRTTEFLYAAARGDARCLRLMMQQGMNPDSVDYDGRTALMLGCARGHPEVITLLLQAGANPHLHDNLGRTALLEAAFAGHDGLISALTRVGARIGGSAGDMSQVEVAALLCSCVFESNLPLLRRLIEAGADANSADYDGRTALHIAAAEGLSIIVRVLVEEGGARIEMRDRWGHTPADEARRVGDMPVYEFLQARARLESEAAARLSEAAPADGGGGAEPGGPEPTASADSTSASMVAAANAARGGGIANGSSGAGVDVGAAVEKVLEEGRASKSADGGGGAAAGGRGAGNAGSVGRVAPLLEPVHRAYGVGHAWSVAMPPGARLGGSGGGKLSGAKRAGGGGGGA